MRIFLGNGPWEKKGMRGVRAGSRWPHFEIAQSPYTPFPFFLAYAAALLKKEGFEVLLVDAVAERMGEAAYFGKMARFAPHLVAHEVATASIATDLAQGIRVKELLPECKLVFCGAHDAMRHPAFLAEHRFVDHVIDGEYELPLLALARLLRDGGALDAAPSLLRRDAAGNVVRNARGPLAELDALPWPAREYLPMNNYWDNPGGIPSPSLQVHASRGCPFTCHFCAWPQIMYGGPRYRTRDPRDVADEIAHCKSAYGIRSFYFDDDTFNIGKERILALCEELCRRRIGLPWGAMARADTADDEMLAAMQAAGLVAIKYGIESGDQGILDASGKKLDLAKARRTVRRTIEMGIKTHLTFTFGLPGETAETIEKTLRLADELNPDSVQFSIATPFPGSRLHAMLQERGHLASGDFGDYDGNARAVIRTDSLSPAALEAALRRAQGRWYRRMFVRKAWANRGHMLREFIRNPVGSVKALERLLGGAR